MGSSAYRYYDIVQDVLVDVPGCPRNLIDIALRRAGRELCVKSSNWREWIAVSAVANQSEYQLSSQWDAEIERIVHVQQDGAEIPKDQYRFDQGCKLVFEYGYQPTTATGVAAYSSSSAYAVNAQVVYNGYFWRCLVAIATGESWNQSHWQMDDTIGLWVRVVLRPAFNATELPDWILEKHADGIASGAKYRLMMEQGRPWSNPNLAPLHKSVFNDSIDRACVEASRNTQFDKGHYYRNYNTNMSA